MNTWKIFTRFCMPLALLAACVSGASANDPQAERAKEAARLEERLRALELLQRARRESLDQLIFQSDGTAAAGRNRQETLLTAQIDEIDQACKLSEAQKMKLQLAGRGDIKRFFDQYETLKQRFPSAQRDEQQLVEVHASVLQQSLRSGLFHEDSLLHKTLPNTLTAEQLTRHEAVARERRATRHRASIELAIKVLERGKPLPDARRRELVTLLTNETKPSRRATPYDHYPVLFYLGRLPPERLRALIGEAHWEAVSRLLEQYVAAVPRLRAAGQLPVEDEDADAPATSVKK